MNNEHETLILRIGFENIVTIALITLFWLVIYNIFFKLIYNKVNKQTNNTQDQTVVNI